MGCGTGFGGDFAMTIGEDLDWPAIKGTGVFRAGVGIATAEEVDWLLEGVISRLG